MKGDGPRREVVLTRPLIERTAMVLLLCGGVVFLAVTVVHHQRLGVFAPDAWAYWRVGRMGEAMYGPPPASFGAFLYSPAFAQAVWPLSQLPWSAFALVWVTLQAAGFIWLLRPLGWGWVAVGLLWCAPELAMANIEAMLAVAAVLAITRFPGAWAFVLLTKPVLGIGVLWHVGRRDWRALVLAIVTTVAVVAVSWLADRSAWSAWFDFLLDHAGEGRQWLPLRIALGAVIMLVAGSTNRAWLVPIGLVAATPVIPGAAVLSLLTAVPRLARRDHEVRKSIRAPDVPAASD